MELKENKDDELSIIFKSFFTGEITDEYIELTKGTEMYKALGLDKIVEKLKNDSAANQKG